MALKKAGKIVIGSAVGGGILYAVHTNDYDLNSLGIVRFGRAAVCVHKRSAERLLELCKVNGGAFIKVGQHIGALEYLLPIEYVETMRVLHSKAPQSPLDDIMKVLRTDLNKEPEEIFEAIDPEPLGAASLAQVHKAKLKDGTTVAVKVQHPLVKAHSLVDMKTMELLVRLVAWTFPEFQFEWLVEEMKKNLPLELDFRCEGENAERVRRTFSCFPWLKVPQIYWDLTTDRVLTMEFMDGGQVNDVEYMKENNISPKDISRKLGDLYSEMIFVQGYVHCDPHPGNVLVQPAGNGNARIVLLDHGLYLTLGDRFRCTYSKFWLSILNADLKQIEKYGEELGVGELFGLFACMVTGRSWNSILSGIDKQKMSSQEQNEIQADASKYLVQIADVLNRVPREMLLIFKTNDLLRSIEYALKTQHSMSSFITMSRCCVRSVYLEKLKKCNSKWCFVKTSASEKWCQFKLTLYQLYLLILFSPIGSLLRLRS
ncbi:aarF domain-containing kinase 1-like isoform X2 [Artemia franciscana]|uniref:aarF domain-containing kinase 1-like isoform X2 n=1 Tax=Artemia franciscana TaxID=6661 RepID=UPI0032DB77C4